MKIKQLNSIVENLSYLKDIEIIIEENCIRVKSRSLTANHVYTTNMNFYNNFYNFKVDNDKNDIFVTDMSLTEKTHFLYKCFKNGMKITFDKENLKVYPNLHFFETYSDHDYKILLSNIYNIIYNKMELNTDLTELTHLLNQSRTFETEIIYSQLAIKIKKISVKHIKKITGMLIDNDIYFSYMDNKSLYLDFNSVYYKTIVQHDLESFK